TVVKLTASLGMLVALPQLADAIFGSSNRLAPPALFLNPNHVYARLGSYPLNGLEISTVIVTGGMVILFGVLIRYTPIGLQMRAVVESPRLAELSGIRSSEVGIVSWALSSFTAGLAGVLLAPLFAQLNSLNFTTLLVSAVAAAAFGGFISIPLALVGGIFLGVGQQVIGGYLPSNTVLAQGLRPGFPFLVLLVLLIVLPSLRSLHVTADPLSPCDPPPPSTAAPHASIATASIVRTWWIAILAFVVGSCVTWIPHNWVDNFSQAMIFAIIFLSITLLTGMSGQISLAQMTFAGIGAFTAGHLASTHLGLPVLIGTLVGGCIAAGLGALVALPSLRLGGLSLALLTLAFALLADNVVFPYSWAGNGSTGVNVPRPQIGSIDFSNSRPFFVLVLTILALCAFGVYMIRRGTTGMYLAAIRGSELAASSIGINVSKSKIIVFSVSAFIAGIGGGLYGSFQSTVSPNDFVYFFSLIFVVVVMIVGSRTVGGAIQAGFAYVLIAQALNLSFLPKWVNSFEPVLFGLAALTFVTHPEGVFEHVRKISVVAIESAIERRRNGRIDRRTRGASQDGTGTGNISRVADARPS
ncbi:MAG TPA: hypothetical protein VMU77_06405, partial [Acidimicrobiales bacterium]|nr:hypothetical protein [Acidimicrobiales bacterium]